MSEERFISCYYRILAKFVLFEYDHVYSEIESQKREWDIIGLKETQVYYFNESTGNIWIAFMQSEL